MAIPTGASAKMNNTNSGNQKEQEFDKLHSKIIKTKLIISNALSKYPNNLAISFNGGKDCTVLLHLLFSCIHETYPVNDKRINALYVRSPNPFPEIQHFVNTTADK